MCFHISLTTPTQIVFQTLLTVYEAQLNLNWSKLLFGSIWDATKTPSHLWHKPQTRLAKLQPKNKWQQDSSSNPHKPHIELSSKTPILYSDLPW